MTCLDLNPKALVWLAGSTGTPNSERNGQRRPTRLVIPGDETASKGRETPRYSLDSPINLPLDSIIGLY